jgi:hypothetical protein
MANLADVSFRAKTADNTQKAYRPSGITCFLSTDTALDYYVYSPRREDAPMLFEEAMMSYRLSILRDVAVTDGPEVTTAKALVLIEGKRESR